MKKVLIEVLRWIFLVAVLAGTVWLFLAVRELLGEPGVTSRIREVFAR